MINKSAKADGRKGADMNKNLSLHTKILLDAIMLIMLALMINRAMFPSVFHEYLGIVLLSAFIAHLVLNIKWIKNAFSLFRAGKQTFSGLLLLVNNFTVIVCTVILLISSLLVSWHIFPFNHFINYSVWKYIHLLTSYMLFILISLHIGHNWSVILQAFNIKASRQANHSYSAVTIFIGIIFVIGALYSFIDLKLPQKFVPVISTEDSVTKDFGKSLYVDEDSAEPDSDTVSSATAAKDESSVTDSADVSADEPEADEQAVKEKSPYLYFIETLVFMAGLIYASAFTTEFLQNLNIKQAMKRRETGRGVNASNFINRSIVKYFIVISISLIFISAVFLSTLSPYSRNLKQMHERGLITLEYYNTSISSIILIQQHLYESISAWNDTYWEKYNELAIEEIWHVDKAYQDLIAAGDVDKASLDTYYTKFEEAIPHIEYVMGMAQNQYDTDASNYLVRTVTPILDEALDNLNTLVLTTQELVNSAVVSTETLSVTVTVVVFITLCIICIILFYCAMMLSLNASSDMREVKLITGSISEGRLKNGWTPEEERLFGPLGLGLADTTHQLNACLHDVRKTLNRMKTKDFTYYPSAEYRGDTHSMKVSLEHILSAYSNNFSELDNILGNILEDTKTFSAIADTLEESCRIQSSSVDVLVDMSDKLKQHFANVCKGMDTANEIIEAVGQRILSSSRLILESNNQMAALDEAMNDIVNASESISSIIETIQDISSQTNLLSINACIKASRAGDSGLGFAVIASEVESLAHLTDSLAFEISNLISENIQNIRHGKEVVANARATIDASAESTKRITEQSGIITDIAANVNNSTLQQMDALNAMIAEISNISSIVSSNINNSAQSEELCSHLSEETQAVRNLTSEFKFAQ